MVIGLNSAEVRILFIACNCEYVTDLSILNMSHVATKFCIVVMFVIAD